MNFDDANDVVKIQPCILIMQKKTSQTEVLLFCFRGAQSKHPLSTLKSSIATIVQRGWLLSRMSLFNYFKSLFFYFYWSTIKGRVHHLFAVSCFLRKIFFVKICLTQFSLQGALFPISVTFSLLQLQ